MVCNAREYTPETGKERVLCYEKCFALWCYYCDWYYRTCRRCAVPGAGSWLSSDTRHRGYRDRRDPADYWDCWHGGSTQPKPPVIAVKSDAYCVLKQLEHTLTLRLPPDILICEHIYTCRQKEGASL